MSGQVVACANMKGGVGKTTVAISLAEGAAKLGRNVLVIDLDLQINASMTLVSDRDGDEPWHRGRTVEDYLRQRSQGQKPKAISLVTQIDDRLHLLSGRLSLVLFERELLTQNSAIFHVSNNIGAWLRELLSELRQFYDLIVIDTPPGLSILAECAIREANLIVVPQSPDRLATQGIEVYAIYLTRHLGLQDLGQKTAVFINMQPSPVTRVATTNLRRIREMAGRSDFPYRLFTTHYPIGTAFREAMGKDRPTTFERLWTSASDHVLAATRELLDHVAPQVEDRGQT